MKRTSSIEGLLDDERLPLRIKIENYLSIELRLRPCSQLTVPAELREAESMGAAIDRRMYPLMRELDSISDIRKRVKAIQHVKDEMRAAYDDVVTRSDRYRALLEWARALGLRILHYEVRPTVREMFLFSDGGNGRELKRLMDERRKILRSMVQHHPTEIDRMHIAYPEEFNAAWLTRMGELLGYPACCTSAYASDRASGVSVEERASHQIEEADRRGPIDPYAYFVGYFFPCDPRCEAARARGHAFSDSLEGVGPGIATTYRSIVEDNLRLVRDQPEIIRRHQARAREPQGR
jgi:hypothetical protein